MTTAPASLPSDPDPFDALRPRLFSVAYRMLGTRADAEASGLRRDLLGHRLVDLVFLRVSQINGCAYCIDMHWRDLIKMDVDPRHLNAVAGWREAPFFDERERAALEWAELVTGVPHKDPDDEAFGRLRKQFTDEEIAELGFVIVSITAWNLLNVSFRNPVPESV